MENKIVMEIIKKVDNNEIAVEGDYMIDEYYGITLVGHKVEGYNLYVYWGEFEDIQVMKDKLYENKITQEEYDKYIQETYPVNDGFDTIDFDKIVAYKTYEDELKWIGRDFSRF